MRRTLVLKTPDSQVLIFYSRIQRKYSSDAALYQDLIDKEKAKILEKFKSLSFEAEGKDFLALVDKTLALFTEAENAKNAAGIDLTAEETRILGPDHKGILVSWKEQEADEVGYEYFLRAGFKASIYQKDSFASPNRSPEETAKCLADLDAIAKGTEVKIERGEFDHPLDCWRSFNISFPETTKHADDYSSLLPGATKIDIFPGELSAAKATLK